jgi:hypothetical protein
VVSTGPLAPDGWLSFALYPVFLVWLIPATIIMIRRVGSTPTAASQPQLAGQQR